MYYSKSVNGFIPDEWMEDGTYNQVPTDAIKLTDQEVKEFHGVNIPGKMVDVSDGRLVWVDLPPPAYEEQVAEAEQQKAALLLEAQATISLWQTELQLGIISDEDKASLIAWMNYIKAVQAVDTSKAPDITWPDKPE